MKCSTLLLFLLPGAIAFEIPFSIPSIFRSKLLSSPANVERADIPNVPITPRVAIVGAGAGGSSAAFWISRAKSRFGLDVEIDVYEKVNYIGGRSTVVYPYDNQSLPELELGASIFVEANRNLWRSSDEFNLTRSGFQEDSYEMGLWDGENVFFTFEDGWWGTMKLLWRYGYTSPKRTQDIVNAMIKKFLGLYQPTTPKWDNIADLSAAFDWTNLTASTTMEYFLHKGISRQYITEFIEAATRVNYAQNADYIHTLEGLCSLAAVGATGIKGGNFQIFEQFLKHSGANVRLNTTVTSILPNTRTSTSSSKLWRVATARGVVDYKAVILAAPFHQADITVPHSISEQIPEQPYIHLHVTLLTTTSEYPNPAYFKLPPNGKPARMMLTTYEGARKGGKTPEFNSLSYQGLVRPGEWAVKIFSMERISDQWLHEMFNGKVGWVHRKEWYSYPKLPPTTTFPPVKLDQGFYYVNSFEPFISTMETETISSRNVVDLLLNEQFNTSICGSRISDSETNPDLNATEINTRNSIRADSSDDNYVYGWDC